MEVNLCCCSPDSPQLELHRALSVEDVLDSRFVRPVGRVTQAFSDGTLLLELIRPPNGPFGFVISRGKGRPDTGSFLKRHSLSECNCQRLFQSLVILRFCVLKIEENIWTSQNWELSVSDISSHIQNLADLAEI